MNLPDSLKTLFKYIDQNQSRYIDILREAIAIPSVSEWPYPREEVRRMIMWTAAKLEALGAKVEIREIVHETTPEDERSALKGDSPGGTPIPLPPIILASLQYDCKHTTILVYGHVDVHRAQMEDGWNTPPFEMVEKDGKLYGRGVTDDKGPVVGWLNVVEAFLKCNLPLPVNLKFVMEGMKEQNSEGLAQVLTAEKEKFLADVDYVCVTDNYWLGTERPCLTYGLRGLCCFNIEVQCASKDLHSGSFGGAVYEGLKDLIYLLDTLTDLHGHVLIDGFYDEVVALSEKESELYSEISFDIAGYRERIGCNKLRFNEVKEQILMHLWRYPTLSIHGIEGAYYEPGSKTVIPGKVIGKFSCRIVPDQNIDKISECVTKHIKEKFEEYGSPNKMSVSMTDYVSYWISNPFHDHFRAAAKAIKDVYNEEPSMTREGGSIPVTLTLQQLVKKHVLMLPIGASDDMPHLANEKLDVKNYIEGTKVMGAYLYEVAKYKTCASHL